jgi:DNA polymerase (family X)
MDKKTVAQILEEMGTLLELQGANPFKSRAFHNASRAMEGLTRDLTTLVEQGTLREVDGVGEKIAVIISDLVTHGRSKEHEELKKSFPPGVPEMLRVQGLGPKKVKILFEKLKIESLGELEAAAQANKLANLDGFGAKTQENILKGIQDLKTRGEKSIYPKAAEAAESIFKDIVALKGVKRAEIAGSLRRKKEVIGDIDIVVSAAKASRQGIMEAFVHHKDVASIIGHGETKSSVVLEAGINCDLRIVDDTEFPFTLNYFTGSKEHNIEMRSRAKKFGWSLNEYGFSELGSEEKRGKAKRIVACKNESDIYKALDLAYVEPELRENTGEIDAAADDSLPELLQYDDIRGTFHCHSKYSDGLNTIEEMALGAKAQGWEYLGIGDHSKVAAYAGGLSEEKVKKQFKEIDELNARLKGFRIFKGTECDVLPNGDLDWSDRVLASFEYVVVSVHSSFKMSSAEMTKRIIKALKNKHVTMLGHPTGRLLLSRDPYPVDMIQVIDAASDYGKMIEINAHPLRLDLDWRLCKYATEKKVMIAVNPDAHTVDGLADVKYGVGIARKGWLGKKNILNAFNTKNVEKYFAHTH